jgi:hypothetical protein
VRESKTPDSAEAILYGSPFLWCSGREHATVVFGRPSDGRRRNEQARGTPRTLGLKVWPPGRTNGTAARDALRSGGANGGRLWQTSTVLSAGWSSFRLSFAVAVRHDTSSRLTMGLANTAQKTWGGAWIRRRGAVAIVAALCCSACDGTSSQPATACHADGLWTGYAETWLRTVDGAFWTIGSGGGGPNALLPPNVPPMPKPFRQVGVLPNTMDIDVRLGSSAYCFTSSTHDLRCADGLPLPNITPVPDVQQIALAPLVGPGTVTVVLKGDGTVWNLAELTNQLTTQVDGLAADVTAVAAGYGWRCARRQDGSVWCWGYGYLGDGHPAYDASNPQPPLNVRLPMPATAIGAGFAATCALLSDASVWCWGDETGNGLSPWLAPMKVNIDGVKSLALGGLQACALKTDGTVWCWGSNFYGEAGYAPDGYSGSDFWGTPRPVTALGDGVVEVSTGFQHSCARKSDNTVWCWGNSGQGQAGNDLVDNTAPLVITGCQ